MNITLFHVFRQLLAGDTAIFFFVGLIAFLIIGTSMKDPKHSIQALVVSASVYAVCEILDALVEFPFANTFMEIMLDVLGAVSLGTAAAFVLILVVRGIRLPGRESRSSG